MDMHQRMPVEPDVNPGLRSCRICFGSCSSEGGAPFPPSIDNCLISPCKCKGSLRWVHRQCIRKWVLHYASPMTERHPLCELCQSPFELKQLGLPSFFQSHPWRRNFIVGVSLMADEGVFQLYQYLDRHHDQEHVRTLQDRLLDTAKASIAVCFVEHWFHKESPSSASPSRSVLLIVGGDALARALSMLMRSLGGSVEWISACVSITVIFCIYRHHRLLRQKTKEQQVFARRLLRHFDF